MSANALLELAHKARALALAVAKAEGSCALPAGLTPASWALLELLRQRGPLTVPKLARMSGSSRQNVQLIINRLEKAGLIDFETNAAHKRSPILLLTADGQKCCEEMRSKREALLAVAASGLSEAELREAARSLETITCVLISGLPTSAKHWPARPPASSSKKAEPDIEEEIPLSLL